MRKIKVLQFPITQAKGGITQYALQNWKFIDRDRFQFDFATMSRTLDFANGLEEEGCRVYYIGSYAEEDPVRFCEEFRRILAGKYDIVHLHTKWWKSFYVEQLAREAGIKKIIVHSHMTGVIDSDEKRREITGKRHRELLEKLFPDLATDYWACSEMAAEFLFGGRIPRNRIHIMKNAVEIEKFLYRPDVREEYRRRLGWQDKCVIGFVGRLEYQKNPEFLLNVFCRLRRIRDKYRLLMVGDGSLREELMGTAQRMGLKDSILFAGYRSEVGVPLQVMDIFALPSHCEGLPLALVEAQTAGLRCICSDRITPEVKITELVEAAPLNEEEWVKRIEYMQAYTAARRNMQSQITKAGYNIKEQIRLIEEEYMKDLDLSGA